MKIVILTDKDGRQRGFNLDHLAEFSYQPERVYSDAERERALTEDGEKLPKRVESWLLLQLAIPLPSGYGNESSTDLYKVTLGGEQADAVLKVLQANKIG